MGLQSSIDIKYSKDIDLKEFLASLSKIGWKCQYNNRITFLVNDNFEWESDEFINSNIILDKIQKRFLDNHFVGLVLVNSEERGGLFHFLPNKKDVMIILSVNRSTMLKSIFTDYTFYSQMLSPVLENVVKITYTDVI